MLDKEELLKVRHDMGYYSVQELCAMFGIGRSFIDNALNSGQLEYISPNAKTRFIKLSDYLELVKVKNEEDKK